MRFENVQAVLFDMDGTLIDTEKWLNYYWIQAAAECGFQVKREDMLAIRSLAEKYAEPYLQELYGKEFSYRKVRACRKEMMSAHIAEHGVEKKPGVDEVLDYLRGHGILTAVVTATEPEIAEGYLKSLGMYDKFDRIISTAMVENGKPAPDVYLYACEQLKKKPQACLAVEDSPNGVRAAVYAGIRTIMVPDLTEPDEETAKLITAKAHTLLDMIRMLEDDNS